VKRRPSQRTAKAPQTSTHKARSHSSTFAKVYGGRKQPFSQPLARLLLLRVSPVGPINYSPLAYTCTELRRFPSSPGKFRRGPQRYAPGQGNPRPVLRMPNPPPRVRSQTTRVRIFTALAFPLRPRTAALRAQQRVWIIPSRLLFQTHCGRGRRRSGGSNVCKQDGLGFSSRLPFQARCGRGRPRSGLRKESAGWWKMKAARGMRV